MKPENRYIAAVHKQLPEGVYAEKMHNPYRGGTFDVWYSARPRDMWVEYKWVERLPVRVALVPDLSALQRDWGLGRFNEGRNVKVVVGSPTGGVVFMNPTEWTNGLLKFQVLSKSDIARWIVRQIME